MRKFRKFAAIALAAVIALGGSFTSYAAGWKQDAVGWWYENADGTYPVNTWYEDTDGTWYFFNEQGYMISNCYRLIDGAFYSFGSDGSWTGVSFNDIYPGVWNGLNYSNEWSGFHLNLPAGCTVKSAAESGSIDSGITFVEFVAQVPDGTGSGVELEYADAYDFPDGAATTPEYVISMHSLMLAIQGYTVDGVTTVTLGGKQYLKLSSSYSGLFSRDIYCRKVGDHYFECLTALSWMASKSAVDALLAGIY